MPARAHRPRTRCRGGPRPHPSARRATWDRSVSGRRGSRARARHSPPGADRGRRPGGRRPW
ncbi:MAG: hypothetical protein E6J69_06420 [Deltaproteobacteria bacterium]|nr:MAG: hypothetical protein E6J69_06420 [Deltaproteobacteria bacterium]TMB42158.1 MAG: hypothetical protein E6J55_16485 [Deltaproteobacteria bacterium]